MLQAGFHLGGGVRQLMLPPTLSLYDFRNETPAGYHLHEHACSIQNTRDQYIHKGNMRHTAAQVTILNMCLVR